MPRIRRERIAEGLMAHLVRRVREREISTAQLGLLTRWLDADPQRHERGAKSGNLDVLSDRRDV